MFLTRESADDKGDTGSYLFACKNSAKTDENRVEKYFDKYSIKDRIYQASLRLC